MRVVNADITLMCEKPKIAPHREAMRKATAEALAIPLDAVSVKATTTEKLGFLGREEGIAAQAVVLLSR
jgi:2-C-methyl-D-erythritol 2,4-cyclodiphosphate synthase